MPRVILAEDSRTQAAVIRITLESQGFQVQVCRDGVEALRAVAQDPPELVLSDLDMPEMDGVELVKALKRSHPSTPAIIMHTAGSEQLAVTALRSGAVGYVMKKTLAEEIQPAYEGLRDVLDTGLGCVLPTPQLVEAAHAFLLDNEPSAILPVIAHLQVAIAAAGAWDKNDCLRICIAAREAIQNAMNHDNLELSIAPFEHLSGEAQQIRQRRSKEPPYRERRVRAKIDVSRSKITISVEDQGRPLNYSDAEAAVNTSLERHRGLVLISNFMDHVTFELDSNRITLIKRACG